MTVVNSPIRIPFHLVDANGDLVIDVTASAYTLRAAINATELTLTAPDISIEQRAVGSSDLVLVYSPSLIGYLGIWGLDHDTHSTNLTVSYIEITQYSTDDAVGRLALKAPLIGQDNVSGTAIDAYPDTDLEVSMNILDDNGDPVDITGKLYNFRVGALLDNTTYNTIYEETAIAASQFNIDIIVDRIETKTWESETKLAYFLEEADGTDRYARAFAKVNVVNIPKE